jgi:hypothetical protein
MDHPRDPPGDRRGSSKGNRTSSQWIRGHCDNPGNDVAERLARTRQAWAKHTPFVLRWQGRGRLSHSILSQWEREWKAFTEGGQLRKTDSTLPAAYTKSYTESCPETGRTCCRSYARAIIGYPRTTRPLVSVTTIGACGAQETVAYVIVGLRIKSIAKGVKEKSWRRVQQRVESVGRLQRR